VAVKTKSAFVAIVGRPSCGKSTFLNAVCGGKVAIVSSVPQTTRNAIRGIVTRDNAQLVFVDTPGIHDSEKKLNQKLKEIALEQLKDADFILYIVDAAREPGKEEAYIVKQLVQYQPKVIAVINKIDHSRADTIRTRNFLAEYLPNVQVYEISALEVKGVNELLVDIMQRAPECPLYYPEDVYTDQEPVFRIAEIIREKIFRNLRDEIPHAVFVEYEQHHFQKDGTLVYSGNIVVERESQKGIVIGAAGKMIQRIREESEKELALIFPYAVKLSLQVRVEPNWKKNDKILAILIQ